TVTTDHSACGRFTDYAAFMFRRADLSEIAPTVQDIIAAADRDGTTHQAPLPPFLEERSLQCLHAIVYPHVRRVIVHSDDGDLYSLSNPATGAWARACPEPGGQATVVHGGPGDLWRNLLDLAAWRSEEHTSELQSRENLVCRLLLEKKKKNKAITG